jgi:NitT/TauT family transport system permease protein
METIQSNSQNNFNFFSFFKKKSENLFNIFNKINLLYYFRLILFFGLLYFIFFGRGLNFLVTEVDYSDSLSLKKVIQEDLQLKNLPIYLFYSWVRVCISIFLSLILSIVIGMYMYFNQSFASLMLYLIDILQSIPILGFVTLNSSIFVNMFGSSILGVQLAIIFTLVITQLWNMCMSVYNSMMSTSKKLLNIAKVYNLSPLQIFYNIYLPNFLPNLWCNLQLSLSASWFMVVAAELILIKNFDNTYSQISIKGLGSFIDLANDQQDYLAIFYALISMILTILLFDNFILDQIKEIAIKARVVNLNLIQNIIDWVMIIFYPIISFIDYLLPIIIIFFIINFFINFHSYLLYLLDLNQIFMLLIKTIFTFSRVILSLLISTIIWIPLANYLSSNKYLSHFSEKLILILSSVPLDMLYGVCASITLLYNLNLELVCTFIMLLETQWYIGGNLIQAYLNIPEEQKYMVKIMNLNSFDYWIHYVIPSIKISFFTGLFSASGAAWNVSTLCEYLEWGQDNTLITEGIGSYLMIHNGSIIDTVQANFVLLLFLTFINYTFWTPFRYFIEKKTKYE